MKLKSRLAVFGAKSAKKTMRLLKRQGTHLPGFIAKKIDKDILTNIEKPENIMVVTGTNGKTTTSNMIADVLEHIGIEFVSNRLGSNILEGVIATLLDSNKMLGGVNTKYGVFEVDELWSTTILRHLKPKTLTITNLFQDSFERNANIYFVRKRIEQGIKNDVRLILNASDSISSNIEVENDKVYFDVENIFDEEQRLDSKIEDMIYCPNCETVIEWDFKRYHHIGKFHCPNCGFKNHKADYLVTKYNKEDNTITVLDRGVERRLPLIQKIIESVYNQIACYATLRENGFEYEQINAAMKQMKVVESRFLSVPIGNKEVISLVQKGYNPVAISRIFDTISKIESKHKTIIYLNQDLQEKHMDHRSPGWSWAIDYKYINEDVDKMIILSNSAPQFVLSMMMDGFPQEKIQLVKSEEEIMDYIDFNKEETIFISHDIERENIAQSTRVIELIKKRMGD
ncbi:MAG: DUF1727 domain-containing protein [Tissierellia bacterium]|nr:DUF1727 domain-containing protein [Tissierellia bacterium]